MNKKTFLLLSIFLLLSFFIITHKIKKGADYNLLENGQLFLSEIQKKACCLVQGLIIAKNKIFPLQPIEKVLWMNVFVHGTVGSAVTFLDFSSVKEDKIENSIYKKTVNMIRKNRYFYQDQPIDDKGLIKVDPSMEFKATNDYYYASYPILKIFDTVNNWYSPKTEANTYYLFGWSGFLSQKRRRSEAIRFYNQLAAEFNIYKKMGFNVKIRILAHSHGGNLSLNLAGIHHSLNKGEKTTEFYSKFEISQYIKELFEKLLSTSFEKEVAINKLGQKKYEFFPEHKNLFVEELIMLGTPIQEETSLFVISPFFGSVYNVYSEGDYIQSMDYVSTIKKQSMQRIDELEDEVFNQVRVIIQNPANISKRIPAAEAAKQKKYPASWWQVVLGLRDTSRKIADPTHKELWFIVPNESETKFNFLRPIPLVCMYPILRAMRNNTRYVGDLDFEITRNDESLIISLTDKSGNPVVDSEKVSWSAFRDLQEQLEKWLHPKENTKIIRGIMNKLISLHRKINM